MAQEPQSVKNHTRFDPAFHFFLAPLALFFVIGTIVRLVRHPAWESALHVLVAIWALVAVFLIRGYSLKVQDRVIRLEERVRLKDLLPPSLQGRIGELTEDQLVGLRFASDGEVAGLTQKTLDGKWKRKQIKEAIQVWRPDLWRV
jgi:hypothetical protein